MGRLPKARSSSPSFFKVLIGDFWDKLCLPKAFVKNFNGLVPKKITLKSCTSGSWMASTKIVGRDIFLCDEWRTFVKDHALNYGEILIFKYDEHSEFHVTIFGVNSCERDIASAKNNPRYVPCLKEKGKCKETEMITKNKPLMRHKYPGKRGNSKSLVTDNVTSVSIRENAMLGKNKRSKKMEVSNYFNSIRKPSYKTAVQRWLVVDQGLPKKANMVLVDQCGTVPFLGNGRVDFRLASTSNNGKSRRSAFMEGMDNAISVDMNGTSVKTHTVRHAIKAKEDYKFERPALTKNQNKRVSSRILAVQQKERTVATSGFTSDNPFCSVTLGSTYVGRRWGYMALPRKFSRKFLKSAPIDVTLQVSNGGSWNARYTGEPHHRLVGGWKTFVWDNHLKENDVCIFELVDMNPLTLKISIIHK